MEFNVAQLLKEPVGATRTYQLVPENENGLYAESVKGRVHFTRTNRGILVRASLDEQVECECSRCLESFEGSVHLDIEEEFFPVIDVITGSPLPPPEDGSAFTISENHLLDISEAVRQYTLLTIPMQPLCKSDCSGLCSQCGANLNLGLCGCEEPSVDPRLAKLASLVVKEPVLHEEKGVE